MSTTTVPLHELGVVEAAGLIARGELSPVDYLETLLARIAALDGRVRTWSNLDIAGARALAAVLADEAARSTASLSA